MKKYQIVRDKANQRGSDFLVKWDAELVTNILYGPLKLRFNTTTGLIEVAKQKQFEQTGYITEDKGDHRNLVVETIWKFSNLSSTQAFNLNRKDIAAALDKPVSFLLTGKDGDVYGKAMDLYKVMKKYEGVLTVLQPADFTEMETVLEDFKNVLSAPRDEIKEKKAEGTDPIPGLLDEMDEIKHFIGKLIQSSFGHLYGGWENAIKVGSPEGVRKTSFVAKCMDETTGVVLRKVKVTLKDGENIYVKLSSRKGYVRFYSLESGNYDLLAEHASYVTQQKNDIGIDDQHIEKTEIKLQKTNPTGILNLTVFDKVTSNPIPGVELGIPALGYTHTIVDDGKVSIDNVNPGDYEGSLSCDGFIELNFNFSIQALKTTSLQLYLEKESD